MRIMYGNLPDCRMGLNLYYETVANLKAAVNNHGFDNIRNTFSDIIVTGV